MRFVTTLLVLVMAGTVAMAADTGTTASTSTKTSNKKTTVAQSRRTTRKTTPYQSTPTYTPSYGYSNYGSTKSPWDFAGQLLLWNPGVGFHALGAYRVVDHLVQNLDDSLSIESGLGFVSVSDTVGAGLSTSYSFIEIPIMARWDIHIRGSDFTVGPRAGFEYLAGGGSVTINGVTYDVRGNSLYFQFGGFGEYKFSPNWAARLDLMLVNWTALNLGVAYFL